MELQITPEPPEHVRRAIEIALAAGEGANGEGAWWRAGVDEAVGESADQAGARPRRSAGADRA